MLLKVHFPFWIIFSLKKFQSIAASKLVEKHWSKWIIKWVILHIGWVTLTQVVAQSKSFESAWGRKLKNTVREKNVGWHQFTQAWIINFQSTRAIRTVARPSAVRPPKMNLKKILFAEFEHSFYNFCWWIIWSCNMEWAVLPKLFRCRRWSTRFGFLI